jgi:hypothetical protein
MFYYCWTIIYKETIYKVGQLGLQILVATVLKECSLLGTERNLYSITKADELMQ